MKRVLGIQHWTCNRKLGSASWPIVGAPDSLSRFPRITTESDRIAFVGVQALDLQDRLSNMNIRASNILIHLGSLLSDLESLHLHLGLVPLWGQAIQGRSRGTRSRARRPRGELPRPTRSQSSAQAQRHGTGLGLDEKTARNDVVKRYSRNCVSLGTNKAGNPLLEDSEQEIVILSKFAGKHENLIALDRDL